MLLYPNPKDGPILSTSIVFTLFEHANVVHSGSRLEAQVAFVWNTEVREKLGGEMGSVEISVWLQLGCIHMVGM